MIPSSRFVDQVVAWAAPHSAALVPARTPVLIDRVEDPPDRCRSEEDERQRSGQTGGAQDVTVHPSGDGSYPPWRVGDEPALLTLGVERSMTGLGRLRVGHLGRVGHDDSRQ
ncbi:MAG: hypothetical protein R2705_20040 [Ilumatobacteraceae bacterium]